MFQRKFLFHVFYAAPPILGPERKINKSLLHEIQACCSLKDQYMKESLQTNKLYCVRMKEFTLGEAGNQLLSEKTNFIYLVFLILSEC